VEASLKAIDELSAGEAEQRQALSSQLEQLVYEAQKAFEQYDAVDARNRLVAAELERRWNESAGWERTLPKSGTAIDALRRSRR
jgi:hypothetical protein